MVRDNDLSSFEIRWMNTLKKFIDMELSPQEVEKLKSRYQIELFELKMKMSNIEFDNSQIIQDIKHELEITIQQGRNKYRQKEFERKLALYKEIAKILAEIIAIIAVIAGAAFGIIRYAL